MRPIAAWPAWLAVAGFAIWTIVRLGGLERGFPAVALIAYTPYVAVLAALGAGLCLFLGQRRQGFVILLCALALIGAVAPRAIRDGPPDPRPDGPELRVAGVNLHEGDAQLEPIAELVRDERIDVVSFAELTPQAARAIGDSEIGRRLPYAVLDPNDGSSGTGLLSRFPLHRLPAPGTQGNDLPTIRAAADLPGGMGAELYSIHPFSPTSSSGVAQLAGYLEAIPPADPSGLPRVLIGDFNSTLDDVRLRDVLDGGYTDAAAARGAGLAWTWPTGLLPIPVTIDHVLVDDRAEVLDFGTADLSGTDHRAVRAVLRLPAGKGATAPRRAAG